MSFSPVPGSGTLLRVEEVRQRLNQCGLQGEKVTRKTARKYVPPTATSSRTVADMARRLGSVGPEGKEHYAKGSCRGEGHINGAEERVVTGEIYRTFSIHTRNIHKRFNREASISEKDDSTDTVNLLSDSPGRKSPIVNKESHSHNIQVNHILSPIPLKIASAPIPHKHAINHISNPSPTPIASDNTPLIQVTHSKTQQSPTQKNETTATGQKTSNGVNNHIVETDKCSQTSNKKLGKSPKTDASPDKQSDENKPFGLKNINPFSMLKISPFNNKKTSTGSKEIEANSSKALSTKEPEQKHTQSQYKTTKSDSYNTKTSQDGGLSKSLSNGNVSGTNLSGHSTPLDKKICAHMKHALSGGRVNIQEIINSPKVPKKDVAGTKNNTKGSKDEKLKNSNSSADKAISSSAQLEKTLGNTQVNGILPHHNIPQLNNTKNNTQTNSNHLNITADHNRRSESSASPTCDKPKDKIMTKEDKANTGSAVAKENGIDVSSEPDKESKKPNGCVESMDCTGVVFYKAKCLLQDSGRMGSKEKVKVDESEPSFYEEAPFERRDVTVKSDRWVTDLYTVDSLLGKGKFGEVKKCQERKTGRQLAAKFIEVNGPQDRNDVLNELEIMKNLQHPRLLQLYDAFEIRDRFCLVMELVNGGELFERVINDDFILTEKACVMFTRQICDGVAFMHSQNILHLDMKPENILCLTREGNRIKIIDFGLARKYNPKDDLRVLFGTPEFVAPEVVNFDPIAPATDMWSIGVVCYVLLSGLSPFMGESEQETLSNVTLAHWDFSAEEFDSISSEAKDFIGKLLVKDPRKRMKSSECLEHQWLRRSVKREGHLPERSLSKKRLRKFVYRRKWQKAINAMLALRRMGVTLS